MKCDYCDSYIPQYPANGTCPNCGAALPVPPTPAASQTPATVVIRQAAPAQPGITCCPRCHSQSIHFQKRGFRWGRALLGLFLLPPFGLLFGLIGRNALRYTCHTCSYRWNR